ncbi:MmgE/PrpD family protein [Amycolatopsis orientalis]|uniref:MmgE/PrpD family protein n=1 Tax=Amycolatopsis orientalis TaxID=31958 RepID=UPI00039E1A9E|nr:MmgE/PrpD family protein [Amycolatopsis orientalis]
MEDLAAVFGQHFAAATFAKLPADAIRAAKFSTLDTSGVILGASGLMDVLPAVVELARESGGTAEGTVFGFGGKLPAEQAAFVNGAMGHGLDFDDHLPEGHHPSVAVLPALLAVAQRRGGVSGAEFLTALALGQDLFARLRKNVAWKQDWFMTPVVGALASAAACGKLLALDAGEIGHAIGIACTQAASTMQIAYGTGGDLRGMYGGFAAKAGVFSALLAGKGVKATSAPLEGRAGFLPVYFGEWDRAAMTAGLGEDFQGSTILYKLWPSCGVTHAYIHTALELMGGPGQTAEIERIQLVGGDFAKQLSEPAEVRRRPPTSNDAKFSLPFTVATALLKGTVGVGDFSAERRADPAVHAVAEKIEFVEDPRYDWGRELPAGAVRISLRGGAERYAEGSHDETPGAARNPLGWDQLTAKFRDCAAHAARSFDRAETDRITATVDRLDTLDDVAVLAEQLG